MGSCPARSASSGRFSLAVRFILTGLVAIAFLTAPTSGALAYDPRGGPLGCLDCHPEGTVQDQPNTFGSGGAASVLGMTAASPLSPASNPWSSPENVSNTNLSGSLLCSNNAKAVCVDNAGNTHSDGVPVGEPIDATPAGGSDSGNLFRYDFTANQYVYNFKTASLSNGTWKIIVFLEDGSSYDVRVGIK